MSQQWRIHTMLKVTNMLLIMKFIVSTVTSYYDIHNDIYFADSDSDYRGSDVNCCWSSDVIFVDSDAQFDVFPPNVYYKNANFWLIFGTNVWQFIVVFLTFWRHLLYLFSVFTSPDVSSLHFAISFLHISCRKDLFLLPTIVKFILATVKLISTFILSSVKASSQIPNRH